MNPTKEEQAMVEVRLRYRPVGDVLTITVMSGAPPGTRFQTEPDDDTLIEWIQMPDGTEQLMALQLIGARSRSVDDLTIPYLPEALEQPAFDLISPGHRHHDHPSAHRPHHPTHAREIRLQTTPLRAQHSSPVRFEP